VKVKEGDLEFLNEIAQFEESNNMDEMRMGWSWRHVRIWPATLSRLFKDGYLDNVFRSNSYTGYRLSELGRAMVSSKQQEDAAAPDTTQPLEIAESIFSDIVGHDEVKELLTACLLAEKPVHLLLAGPPALAKTLFLWDIERVAGERAIWLLGSGTSKSGLWDKIAEGHFQIILIDELDKMDAADTAALLSLMEGGRLVRAKRGRELNLTTQVRVVAASNHLDKLSPELKSRFAIRKLMAYNRSDYLTVVRGVLVTRENLDEEQADEVARGLDGLSQDVRQAVMVARVAPRVGIKKAIKLIIGGDSNEK
jgi:holliday junction DNA helicase RuvB